MHLLTVSDPVAPHSLLPTSNSALSTTAPPAARECRAATLAGRFCCRPPCRPPTDSTPTRRAQASRYGLRDDRFTPLFERRHGCPGLYANLPYGQQLLTASHTIHASAIAFNKEHNEKYGTFTFRIY
ncbi:jg4200 [Pararge aegeria aegeria]|uniref:Jg4200 protein n=1 Tax=Pararge aegeria aegeria TaxID=348720 RepID=A0A8S4R6D5_9NEOP|nr:jg4200 [Pararge aegeria aegeria]